MHRVSLMVLGWAFSICFATAADQVTVGGFVSKPGPVVHHAGMTLEEAIAAAGAATEFGSLKKVTVNRGGETTRHDLTSEEGKIFRIEPSDEVIVLQKTLCSEEQQ